MAMKGARTSAKKGDVTTQQDYERKQRVSTCAGIKPFEYYSYL